MRKRILTLSILIVLFALVLLGCSMGRGAVSSVTATPTKTQRPLFTSTFTPTATPQPSDTPPPTAAPSDTAVVPTDIPPSDTPPPTAAPSDTAVVPTDVPPTDTAVAPTDAPPTDTPRPKPTNTPTNTPKPQLDFRVVEQRLMSKTENEAQRHMILIRVVDAGGNPLHGLTVWDPNHPEYMDAVTGSKPEPYHAEYTFWNYDAYQLEVMGAKSEKTKVLSTLVQLISKEDLVGADYCPDVSNCNYDELHQHYSWYVTFQRTW